MKSRPDEDRLLARRSQSGDEEATDALVRRYTPLVHGRAGAYYLPGGEHDDLVQEGMIGLLQAIRGYRFDRSTSFHTFVELVVTRRIQQAVTLSGRHKHRPLNGYASLSYVADPGEDMPIEAVLCDARSDTAEKVIAMEEFRGVMGVVRGLSPFERRCLGPWLSGHTYREIAVLAGAADAKAVDNAVRRIKRKVGEYLALEAA